jgi:hypothetical protein
LTAVVIADNDFVFEFVEPETRWRMNTAFRLTKLTLGSVAVVLPVDLLAFATLAKVEKSKEKALGSVA